MNAKIFKGLVAWCKVRGLNPESPVVLNEYLKQQAPVGAYEPVGKEKAKEILGL